MDKKSFFSALAGHVLERYDVGLYGIFVPFLAPIFFPSNDEIATIATLGTFAAGYIMRPLGGVLFGYAGDVFGRKRAFSWSILLVSIPTFTMAVLPGYKIIGLTAPIILIICRLFQGFCAGGEFTGAAIFITEHMRKNQLGLSGGVVCFFSFLGLAIGSALGALMTASYLPEWGWRMPFLLGSILGVYIYYSRRQLKETPIFEAITQLEKLESRSFIKPLRNHKLNLFCSASMGALGHILLYMTTVYVNVLYVTQLHLSPSQAILINCGVLILWMIFLPTMGLLSDYVGVKKFLYASSLLVVTAAYPIFWYMDSNFNLNGLLVYQLCMSIMGAAFMGPMTGYFTQLFPPAVRYRGSGLSLNIGQAVLGGTAPLIGTFLVNCTGDRKAPAILVIIGGILGFLGVFLSQQHITSKKKEPKLSSMESF